MATCHLQIPFVEAFLEWSLPWSRCSTERSSNSVAAIGVLVGVLAITFQEGYRLVSHKPGVFESLGVARSSSFPDKFQITREHLDIPCQVMEFMGFGATKAPKGRGNSMGTTTLTFNDWNLKKHDLMSMRPAMKSFFPQFPWHWTLHDIENLWRLLLKMACHAAWTLRRKMVSHNFGVFIVPYQDVYTNIHTYMHRLMHIFYSARNKQS